MHMDDSIETLRLFTLSQAAKLLHVSIRTFHRMIHKQEVPAFKVVDNGAYMKVD
jgi:excisionase family DNA binding protein